MKTTLANTARGLAERGIRAKERVANLKAAVHALNVKVSASGPTKVWVIMVDGRVDQLVDSLRVCKRECADLRALDCGKVTTKEFAGWAEAEAFEDKKRGY